MTRIVFKLGHFQRLGFGDIPNLARHSGKVVGTYTSEAHALDAVRRVVHQPGFRDWPDGFRLFPIDVDRTHFKDGFVPGPDGLDIALADDPSPLVGDDSALGQWPDEESEFPLEHDARLRAVTEAESAGWLWHLSHFKVTESSEQDFDDMGEKLIGVYSSQAAARRAIGRLRDKSGFRDWPGGFRLIAGAPGGIAFAEGFVDGMADD